jgi:hypothetical protein
VHKVGVNNHGSPNSCSLQFWAAGSIRTMHKQVFCQSQMEGEAEGGL